MHANYGTLDTGRSQEKVKAKVSGQPMLAWAQDHRLKLIHDCLTATQNRAHHHVSPKHALDNFPEVGTNQQSTLQTRGVYAFKASEDPRSML